MTELALVGDIGGTNSRFGLVEPGTTRVAQVAVQKNDNFASLEDSIASYVKAQGVSGGWSVRVLWVVNDLQPQWEAALPEDTDLLDGTGLSSQLVGTGGSLASTSQQPRAAAGAAVAGKLPA